LWSLAALNRDHILILVTCLIYRASGVDLFGILLFGDMLLLCQLSCDQVGATCGLRYSGPTVARTLAVGVSLVNGLLAIESLCGGTK
jgi:hypothetical protein